MCLETEHGTCRAMWYSGMEVTVKSYDHPSIQEKHILMEAWMLEVGIHFYRIPTTNEPQ